MAEVRREDIAFGMSADTNNSKCWAALSFSVNDPLTSEATLVKQTNKNCKYIPTLNIARGALDSFLTLKIYPVTPPVCVPSVSPLLPMLCHTLISSWTMAH